MLPVKGLPAHGTKPCRMGGMNIFQNGSTQSYGRPDKSLLAQLSVRLVLLQQCWPSPVLHFKGRISAFLPIAPALLFHGNRTFHRNRTFHGNRTL